jgi:hypothetical protein
MKVHVSDIDWDTTGDDLTEKESLEIKKTLPTEATVEVEVEEGEEDDMDEIVINALEELTESQGLGRWCLNSFNYELEREPDFTESDILDMLTEACSDRFGSCVKSGNTVFLDDGAGGTWSVKVEKCEDL